MLKTIIRVLIILIICTGIHLTQRKLDYYAAQNKKYYVEKNLLITLPTHIVCNATLGFNNLIADILWLQFIQYFGENNYLKRTGSTKYDFSFTYKYIDVITALDPGFGYAYWFGAFAIADEMERPDLAIKLLDEGIKNNPKNWWLPYTACVMEMMYNNDFVAAAKYAEIANKVKPDNPKLKRIMDVMSR